MKKIITFIVITTAIILATDKSFASTQDIIINEIGASEPSGYEWIEIYNRGQNAIDLTGWKFVEDFSDAKPDGTSHNLNFNDGVTISSGQYALIVQDQNKFKEKYPNFTGLLIDSSWGSLIESGEKIGLKDADGNFPEIFTYLEVKDHSLERKDSSLNDYTSSNWQEHPTNNTVGVKNYSSILPTPTDHQTDTENSAPIQNDQTQQAQEKNISSSSSTHSSPLIADAGVDMIATVNQEIILDASRSQGAQDYEWNFGDGSISKEKITKHSYDFPGKYIITLTASNGSLNAQSQIVATIHPSGVHINEFLPSPQGSDSENEWVEIFNSNDFPIDLSGWIMISNSKKFLIPQNTFIAPQNYLVLTRKITKISLGNSDGSLKFYYPENILIDEINYEKTKEGFSASRKQDGNFTWTQNTTPSGPNIFSSDVNSKQSSNLNSPRSVTENNTDAKNMIINNQTFISSENFITKSFIGTALAQTVQEDIVENISQQKNDYIDTQDTNDQNKETQANIGKSINADNILLELIIVLAMIGFFALMWRVIRQK